MILSPQAKERLALQHQKYLGSLPAKRERLLSCWQGIQVNGWNCECFDELKMEIHRLSGSAGSYGLEELGNAAKQLDLLLASGREISVHSTNIVDLVDTILAELDDAVKLYSVSPAP